MTLPLTGTLEASDINVELGRSATATFSIKDAATGVYGAINTCSPYYPNATAPHAYSEWYGYNHNAPCLNSNFAMSDGQVGTFNGLISGDISYDTGVSSTKPDPAEGECTWSFWFKPINTIEIHGVMYTLVVDPDNLIVIYWVVQEDPSNPGVYWNYIYLTYGVFDGVNPSGFLISRVNISDSNNNVISGVLANSPWGIGNYGNVDSTDYALITVVVSSANIGTNDYVTWYWNETKMDVPLTSASFGNSYTEYDNLRSPDWTGAVMTIGGTNFGDYPAVWAQLDGFAIYPITSLTSGDVTAVYNGGAVADISAYQGISTDLLYYNFESNTPNLGIDTGGNYSYNLAEYNNPIRVNDPAV
jgi:hypothetical protein